jgi:hypothetical protein
MHDLNGKHAASGWHVEQRAFVSPTKKLIPKGMAQTPFGMMDQIQMALFLVPHERAGHAIW